MRGGGRPRTAEHRRLPDIGDATEATWSQSGGMICVYYSRAGVVQQRIRFKSRADIAPADLAAQKLAAKLGLTPILTPDEVSRAHAQAAGVELEMDRHAPPRALQDTEASDSHR